MTPVRCKKCRKTLFIHPECPLLNAHGNVVGSKSEYQESCMPPQRHTVWYLDADKVPNWMSLHVEEAGWTKGKLCCPQCHCRLGAFDFVSGGQCPCHSYTLPPMHLTKAKVDAFLDES